jgi:hypothetical protein
LIAALTLAVSQHPCFPHRAELEACTLRSILLASSIQVYTFSIRSTEIASLPAVLSHPIVVLRRRPAVQLKSLAVVLVVHTAAVGIAVECLRL